MTTQFGLWLVMTQVIFPLTLETWWLQCLFFISILFVFSLLICKLICRSGSEKAIMKQMLWFSTCILYMTIMADKSLSCIFVAIILAYHILS